MSLFTSNQAIKNLALVNIVRGDALTREDDEVSWYYVISAEKSRGGHQKIYGDLKAVNSSVVNDAKRSGEINIFPVPGTPIGAAESILIIVL